MLTGFHLQEKLFENSETLVYRAKRGDEGKDSIIVKLLIAEYPSTKELSRIKHEYEITKSLDLPGVVRALDLLRHNNGFGLILEDVGGTSLNQLLKKGKLNTEQFLDIAISIAETLGKIHEKGVIHKDIKPSNLLVSSDGNAYITDFGLSTRLSQEKARYSSASVMEGTLAYIAPEQTGRMNRSIDHRSDLYSLGITYYEMLIGKVPFLSTDPMELVHSHIAKVPLPPHEVDPGIPKKISEIVMKLLSKTAEDRYQSSYGLVSDLKKCLHDWKKGRTISDFRLGEEDLSGRFQIPQKLYGRETERAALLSAFDRVSHGATELLLVSGYSGVGKSSLVHEVYKPITEKKGLFISGKFDQYQRDIPYYAIRLALRELCEYLVTEEEEALGDWRAKILNAMQNDGQVVIDIVPDLEVIIGKQPPVPQLGAQETQNRLNNVFQRFLGAISQPEHPLVLFIDDLQWADSGSLSLIKLLLTGRGVWNFLLIGAYRDNEVDSHHPLVGILEETKVSGCPMQSIKLGTLAPEDVTLLVSESLGCSVQEAAPLSQLVHTKTGGNAFFVNEFLRNLYDEKLVQFDHSARSWSWNVQSIEAKNVTGNVVELMAQKIGRMPENTQTVLEMASCVGAQFSLKVLSIIFEKKEQDTLAVLWKAIEEGLIIPLDNHYKMYQVSSRGLEETTEEGEIVERADVHLEHLIHDAHFRFLHDRVQEASYAQIKEDRKKIVHLTIGRLLLERTEEAELPEIVFAIVNQFNLGSDLITEKEERLKVAGLNLFAGRKAKFSIAYNSAITFLTKGIEYLPEGHWRENFNLSFDLYFDRAFCEYSAAQLDECEQDVLLLLKNTPSTDDKVKIYQIYLNVLYSQNRHRDGIQAGRDILKLLGVRIPKNVQKVHIALRYIKFRMILGLRKADDILDLKKVTDKRVYNICCIIFDLVPSAYQTEPDLMGYISVVMATYCLQNGNSIYAPFAYSVVGVVMAGVTKELETSYAFLRMAEKLNEKYYDLTVKARVHFIMGNFSLHWIRPIAEYRSQVELALQCALEAGTINWADYALTFCRAQSIFFTDNSLSKILEENTKYYHLFRKHKDREVILNQYSILRYISFLMGKELDVPLDYPFSEEGYEKEMHTHGNYTIRGYFYFFRMVNDFDHERWEQALENGWGGFKIVIEVLGNMLDFTLRYYYVLSYLSYRIAKGKYPGLKYRIAFKINRFLLSYYSRKNPANFLCHNLLISALQAQIANNVSKAVQCFEKAIKESQKAGFLVNEALANELAAKFYILGGSAKAASGYMTEAHYLYSNWGAFDKIRYIEEKYGAYLKRTGPSAQSPVSAKSTGESISVSSYTTSSVSASLDLGTVLKASQAISSEIRLDKLLSELLQNLIENTGAEKGLLILDRNHSWLIEAEGDAKGQMSVLNSEPVKGSAKVPHNIINYVIHSRTPLIVSNVAQELQFQNDPYIKSVRPRSIICAPIIHQGKLTGLVYLENRLVTDVFTAERLQMVNVISAQAAISLENSTLYENLEGKVKERTEELSVALDKVHQMKQQQDADYFLTSLLLHPLGQDKTTSNTVHINFLLKQKKQFTFKQEEHTIGGDICSANNIVLKGRKYTVFMNADAMGKSIQGAAGALITGSVFESIVQRTKLSDYWQKFQPELWVRNCFIELQKVFENLDGAMLISILIGIVDDETGAMYSINSDYPSPILLRDGKAQYLYPSHTFLKLGVDPGLYSHTNGGGSASYHYLSVDVFQLENGDVLVTGSDGKDDLYYGLDEQGAPIKKQNETMILSLVEETEGDLDKMYERIRKEADLIDDLSMMRLSFDKRIGKKKVLSEDIRKHLQEYKKNIIALNYVESANSLKKAYKLGYKDPIVLKSLAKLNYLQKKYRIASVYAERYYRHKPIDNHNLYLLSLAYQRLGKIKESRQIAECLVLRKASNATYLSHYADVLLTSGNSQFKHFISRANEVNPNSRNVQRVLKRISQSVSNN
ncbi:histidine kinase [Leptospira perolatii]|uniref:Histidine kinase n=1 Tax=Leptospira perolatii TaxID=2023191 RepID=A0A2M9ZQU3_9LEPT|nr:trifunctional serine/threonine-protein kinase/ATP-binding protein/SpoIIE family protein phosphatase [Leptospira perolatii]PJZ70505.1 histidine kinase [Leptospira perolatii]PJZ74341.1 histidine kinase [Leptospira perolatii]